MSRVKISIRCRACGEKYILRGRKTKDAYETGFKMCICNNAEDFEFEEHPV